RQPARRQDRGRRRQPRLRRGRLRSHARRPDPRGPSLLLARLRAAPPPRAPTRRDRSFSPLASEKLDRKAPQDTGPTGSDFPVEIPGVTQADYDRIRQIGLDVYGYDVGETLRSAPEEDEKILAKLDWNINELHRATLAYQRTTGNELIVNSLNNNASTRRLGAPSNWYDRAIAMKTFSLQLFSDWTPRFSTELKMARK